MAVPGPSAVQPALDSVVFEDVPAAVPAAAIAAPPGRADTVRTSPVAHRADMRIPRVLAELREIQVLLSRDEP